MSENEKRRQRISSPEYRNKLGKALQHKREELYYNKDIIAQMLGIPQSTITNIEEGITTNIDYYVEYAKAVKYPLATLNEFGIEMKPLIKVPTEILTKNINFSQLIKSQVVESKFLDKGKSIGEIKEFLLKNNVELKEVIMKSNISNIMRNLIKENIVEVMHKEGSKDIYVRK